MNNINNMNKSNTTKSNTTKINNIKKKNTILSINNIKNNNIKKINEMIELKELKILINRIKLKTTGKKNIRISTSINFPICGIINLRIK